MDLEPYMSTAQAADRLGYTIQHVRRLVRQGVLAGFKVGRDWVVSREDVEAFAARDEYLSLPLTRSGGQ